MTLNRATLEEMDLRIDKDFGYDVERREELGELLEPQKEEVEYFAERLWVSKELVNSLKKKASKDYELFTKPTGRRKINFWGELDENEEYEEPCHRLPASKELLGELVGESLTYQNSLGEVTNPNYN